MAYFSELRSQWRALVASMIGLGSGFSLTMYTTSIMAPHLLREFGWSKSQFALITTLSVVTIPVFPLIGRLADTVGVRRTALIGVIALPLTFLGFRMMNGDIRMYIALFLAQSTICLTTTSTVYSRTVVQYIASARGLALAIVASGPALTGAIGAPLLNNYVEAHGWRSGYQVLIIFSIVAGGLALLLMPPERKVSNVGPTVQKTSWKTDFPEIIHNPAFWILLSAMLLCNVALAISQTQLKLVLLDDGATPAAISTLISALALGILAGRFFSGVALDRFPAHLVALIAMALPSIGLFLLASHVGTQPIMMAAVLFVGFSLGGEGDIVGFLVARHFEVRVYSSVLGIMTAAIATSASLGAALLSLSLKLNSSYTLFLLITGVTVAIGSSLFLILGRLNRREPAKIVAT
jgi:MFS family permease